MVKVTFRDHSGGETVAETEPGQSLMELAVAHDVSGVVAECGGACSCGTCHVYVDAEWLKAVGAPAEEEADMLEFVVERRENSRLSCQIPVTDALDGLAVTVPQEQRS